VQHLMLMMVAPPLALLGIVGMRPLPAGWAPRLRAVWTRVTRPWPALIIFNVVLLVWHIPQLYNTTLTNGGLHVFEHLTFVLVGVIFWWPIVDPIRGLTTKPVGSFQKIVMLVLAGVPPTVLGFILAMSQHAFYSFYEAAPRLWGMSPTGDQAVAGVVMLGVGNLIYFVAVSVIFLRMFGDPAADEAEIGLGMAR
jgi:cytochrome c oxidase assembly factor CtaG